MPVICPLCNTEIADGHTVAFVNGVDYHLGCYDRNRATGKPRLWGGACVRVPLEKHMPNPSTELATAAVAPLEAEIRAECAKIADILVEKNRAYGNSVGEPIRCFAKRADDLLQIDVRIDDKLNRIKCGREFPGDDTTLDLVGYLILRRVIQAKKAR